MNREREDNALNMRRADQWRRLFGVKGQAQDRWVGGCRMSPSDPSCGEGVAGIEALVSAEARGDELHEEGVPRSEESHSDQSSEH